MVGLKNNLAMVEKRKLKVLEIYDKKYGDDPQYDRDGSMSTIKKSSIRFIALCDYKLRHDIQGFRANLRDSADMVKSLYDRYNQGDPIDDSFVSMNSFGHILDACAAGDFALAEAFAKVIGGREALEKYHDHPFDFAFGYALKATILADKAQTDYWLPLADKEVKRSDVKYFQAYVDCLYAIRHQDKLSFQEGMIKLLQDHKKMCRAGGLFENNDDEVLCFWGLGLINFARHQGLPVTIDDEFLPKELII